MMAGAGATAIMATALFAAESGQQPPGQGPSIAIRSEGSAFSKLDRNAELVLRQSYHEMA
jgi:hypothetical protein